MEEVPHCYRENTSIVVVKVVLPGVVSRVVVEGAEPEFDGAGFVVLFLYGVLKDNEGSFGGQSE